MKKILSFIAALAMTAAITVPVSAQAPTVFLDGVQLTFDAEPFIENDRTLVPMRAIFEAMGATILWDQQTLTVMGVKDDNGTKKVVTLQIGTPTAFVNSDPIVLDVPAKVVSDRTFVPLRFISESLDADVQWDGDAQSVIITTK